MKPAAHILIVDDMPTNLRVLVDLLASKYEIHIATSGADALAVIKSEPQLDLILLDVMMPGIDGYAVCRELKSHPEHGNTPVIFITAKDEVEDETYGFEVGAVDYITKPFDDRVVLARVKNQLLVKSALAREREVLEAQRQFISMISHEFRQPLAIIDTATHNLDTALESRLPALLPKTGKIRQAVNRLLNLMENCLAADRLDSSGIQLQLEDVDMCDFLQRNVGCSALGAPERIRLQLPDKPLRLRCDPHLFDITLSNLVDNALKYSPPTSPVEIRLTEDLNREWIQIEVSDQGAGIKPEDRERIFGRFQRGQGLGRTSGAGLGLHLARELVRRHGGDVVLAPAQARQGATFVLTLPKAGVSISLEA